MKLALVSVLAFALTACGGQPPAEPPPPPPAPEKPEAKAPAPRGMPITGEITVITTKNGSVDDQHTLAISKGALADAEGKGGHFEIDLGSWKSEVQVRDDRVKEMFLAVADAPVAKFSMKDFALPELEVGASADSRAAGELELRGHTHAVAMDLVVERASKDSYEVTSKAPVELTAADLGLAEDYAAVAEACGVTLADTVKVSVAATLGKAGPADPAKAATAPDEGPVGGGAATKDDGTVGGGSASKKSGTVGGGAAKKGVGGGSAEKE